ncbi:diacylglycerol/lipid kinase family protein [Parabacteroides sp. FAFU027]|uniref:diacylglycerol/lipid kinase family protein n=1 Tax=Parabacteroides sp. FAFU027 TaxID=2922715 RepID=UPI001FB01426|nr:diacylglycerol kinase family protein [Parabacteroides sp. FAFU027]
MVKNGILVIINPRSGIRLKPNIARLTRSVLDKERFDINISMTEYAGHATELAKQAIADGMKYVIVAGGDGTINEVAKALIHSEVAMGIIPIGSGNGLARHIGIPLVIREALQIVNNEKVENIDYCEANGHLFFTTCGVGFDARVSYKFSKGKHRGGINYLRSMMTEYLNYKPETYELVFEDEKRKEKAFLITCANASQYGNNAFIAPQADLKDGMMDVAILKPFTPLDILPISLQLFTKKIDSNSKIEIIETPQLTIHREKAGEIHLDGEPMWMDKTIVIKTIPAGLKVLVPQNRKEMDHPLQVLFGFMFQQIKTVRNFVEI